MTMPIIFAIIVTIMIFVTITIMSSLLIKH